MHQGFVLVGTESSAKPQEPFLYLQVPLAKPHPQVAKPTEANLEFGGLVASCQQHDRRPVLLGQMQRDSEGGDWRGLISRASGPKDKEAPKTPPTLTSSKKFPCSGNSQGFMGGLLGFGFWQLGVDAW